MEELQQDPQQYPKSPHENQLQQSLIDDTLSQKQEEKMGEEHHQFNVKVYNSNASQTFNQFAIAERCKLWKEQREKRLKEAQEIRKQQLFEAAGCTFQPNITRPQVRKGRGAQPSYTQQDFDQQIALDNHKKGLDRYLQRMDKAKEIKEQKAKLEEHLFERQKNWKPKLTQPKEPKLSGFLTKDRKEVTVKALSKPIDILAQSQDLLAVSKSQVMKREEEGTSKGGVQKKTEDFIKLTQKTKSQYVEIKPEMTYEDAVLLIHQHILNLDL